MKRFNETRKVFTLSLLCLLILASCASREDVVYLQDTGNFETTTDKTTSITKFKVDDVVSIFVSSLNPEASAPFNLVAGGGESGLRAEPMDYLVDQDGMIDFPVIGKLKIEGLSPDELRIMLRERLAEYLKDPIINIRLRNFTVTLLGAVSRPGTYPTTGEQLTILEALGLAGDMTIRGRRDNILVIREFNGTKQYTRIDLTTKNVVDSPVYYLTQNDVVYVEPNKQGINETSIGASTALTFSVISLLITSTLLIITRL